MTDGDELWKLRDCSLSHGWPAPSVMGDLSWFWLFLFNPFYFLASKDLKMFWLWNILALSVPGECSSRNASCALSLISIIIIADHGKVIDFWLLKFESSIIYLNITIVCYLSTIYRTLNSRTALSDQVFLHYFLLPMRVISCYHSH